MDAPLISADGVSISVQDWDVKLDLYRNVPSSDGGESKVLVGRIALPHSLAKVVSIALRKSIQTVEDRNGHPFVIPPGQCESLGISIDEDWT